MERLKQGRIGKEKRNLQPVMPPNDLFGIQHWTTLAKQGSQEIIGTQTEAKEEIKDYVFIATPHRSCPVKEPVMVITIRYKSCKSVENGTNKCPGQSQTTPQGNFTSFPFQNSEEEGIHHLRQLRTANHI